MWPVPAQCPGIKPKNWILYSFLRLNYLAHSGRWLPLACAKANTKYISDCSPGLNSGGSGQLSAHQESQTYPQMQSCTSVLHLTVTITQCGTLQLGPARSLTRLGLLQNRVTCCCWYCFYTIWNKKKVLACQIGEIKQHKDHSLHMPNKKLKSLKHVNIFFFLKHVTALHNSWLPNCPPAFPPPETSAYSTALLKIHFNTNQLI